MSKRSNEDPLALAELDPVAIQASIDAKRGPTKEDKAAEREAVKAAASRQADLNAIKAAGAAKAEKAAADKLDAERSKLLDRVMAYKERFPHLKSRNKTLKTTDEIKDELHYLELQLGSSKENSLSGNLLYAAMCGVESLTETFNPLNLNLAGLGQVTKSNMAQFEPLMDELMIKWGGPMSVPVEMRLALALSSVVISVHKANSGDPGFAQAVEKMNKVVKPVSGAKDL